MRQRHLLALYRGSSSRTQWTHAAHGAASNASHHPTKPDLRVKAGSDAAAAAAAVDVRALIHELLGSQQQQAKRQASLADGDKDPSSTPNSLKEGQTTRSDAMHGTTHGPAVDSIRGDTTAFGNGDGLARLLDAKGDASRGGDSAGRSLLPMLISRRKVGHAEHFDEMRRSLFCLCPSGDQPNMSTSSPFRLAEREAVLIP